MRRAVGPVLAALATGLLLTSTAVAHATPSRISGSAAEALASAGAVSASRAELGSCVTLTGGGFAPLQPVDVSDEQQHVRTVHSGANGQILAGICFNGAARPGIHTVSATGPRADGGTHTISSDVYVVGGSEIARPPHHTSAAGHTRVVSLVTASLLVGLPLVVLVVTVIALVRAGGRVRSRRRLRRQAADAALLLDSTPSDQRPSRLRAACIPLLAGLAVAVLLCVAYGAARATHLMRQVRHATDNTASAVRHLQLGETDEATAQAQRAVNAAASAHRDESDPVVRTLARLPGLKQLADAVRVERSVAESVSISVGGTASEQKARAAADRARLDAVHDTGWSPVDSRLDSLRATLEALGGQARARVSADDLRGPMLAGGRRYLLLVQDDHRARATGGVITVHALIKAGAHSLSLDDVTPAGRKWQAINLTPDFPEVASAAATLWRQSGGPPVDGVVAIDDVALSRLGADPSAEPFDQLRAAFDALRAATSTPIGFDATIVGAASGGHVQLWSAHPDEEGLLSTLSVGGAVGGRPENSVQVVTESLDDTSGAAAGTAGDAGDLRRDISYAWRPTLRRDDLGDGLQLINQAGLDVRLTNTSAAPQATWVLLYLPPGTGFTHAAVDGAAVSLHAGQDHAFTVLSTVLTVPANGTTLLSLQMLSPTPDGQPPVYVPQPRVVADNVAVTRV